MRKRIVIMGRPNVGKSTLFNRLVGSRRALVHDMPGVTRDRMEHEADWWIEGKKFPTLIVDTGGLGGEHFAEEIARQVDIALNEADLVIMLFDGQAGYTAADRDLVRKLKSFGIADRAPVFGVVNKVDANVHEDMIADFYAAGLEPLLTISAEHGRGIDDLQRAIAATLGPVEAEDDGEVEAETGAEAETEAESESDTEVEEDTTTERRIPRVAIIGQPNVGKSTLMNTLLGEERMITSPIAGTTVDAIDSTVEISGRPFIFVDTAGIRRKGKTEQGVEVLSVVQARKALERADVALLLLDGEKGTVDQDEKIGGLIEEVGCGVILVVNKWDTQKRNQKFTREMAAERIRGKMAFLRYAPIMFVSAKERTGLQDLADLIDDILQQRKVKLQTKEFTEWVRKEATIHNPANAKFFLCHQTGRRPPTFVCHVNDPDKIHFSLRRHLLNAMRERWGFMGSPVRLLFKQAQNRKAMRKAPTKTRKTVAAAKEKRNVREKAELRSRREK